jgi:iron complex transport system substrate-binding protein
MEAFSMLKPRFVFIIALSVFCAAGSGFPVKITDDRGKEIRVEKVPQRIVSLVPSHTEILFALGLENQLAAVTDYCDYPARAREKPRIGGFINASAEKIAALKPDLILTLGTVQMPLVQQLEKKGLTVFWLYPKTVSHVLASFERIGQLTGKIKEGRELREKVEKKIIAVTGKLDRLLEADRPAVVRVMNINPPGTIGNQSFQTDVFYLAGGKNAFSHIDKDFFPVEKEALKTCSADVIIICGSNPQRAKQLKDQPVWRDLQAVKQDKILVIPCNLICRPGPRIADSIETIARYLHPDKFNF